MDDLVSLPSKLQGEKATAGRGRREARPAALAGVDTAWTVSARDAAQFSACGILVLKT